SVACASTMYFPVHLTPPSVIPTLTSSPHTPAHGLHSPLPPTLLRPRPRTSPLPPLLPPSSHPSPPHPRPQGIRPPQSLRPSCPPPRVPPPPPSPFPRLPAPTCLPTDCRGYAPNSPSATPATSSTAASKPSSSTNPFHNFTSATRRST